MGMYVRGRGASLLICIQWQGLEHGAYVYALCLYALCSRVYVMPSPALVLCVAGLWLGAYVYALCVA